MVTVQTDADDESELARRATEGNGEAFGLLFERWFDRAFDVAWHIVRNRDTAAEVTQEAFASAWQQIGGLRQPESFGGWLLRIARNKALNRLEREGRSRPLDDEATLVRLDDRRVEDPADDLGQRERQELVWAASAALGDADASVLNLHVRHGLEAPELAEELGVKPNAAHQRLFRLKQRLADAIGAWVLWRHGTPSCEVLRTALVDAGLTRFDAATSKAVVAHARQCPDCDANRELRLSPEALFGAMPLVVAEPGLRAKVVAALEDTGVPARAPGAADATASAADGDAATADAKTSTTDLADTPPHGAEPANVPTADTDPRDEPEPIDEPPPASPGPRRRTAFGAAAAVIALVVGGVTARALLVDEGSNADTEAAGATAGADPTENATTTTAATTTDKGTTTTSGAAADEGTGGAPVSPNPQPQAEPPQPDPTSPGTVSSDTTEAATPPVIGGFRASPGRHACDREQVPTAFVWSSSDATSATLGPIAGSATPVDPEGSVAECSTPGATWVLTVTGPGGTASASADAPSPPR